MGTTSRMDERPVALEIANVSKTFGGTRVLKDFSMTLRQGEIRGLVGQNGSGKSTLIKILDGFHSPDPGATGQARGHDLTFSSHHASRALGLRFIHQDLGLVPTMTITDNVAMAYGYDLTRPWINWRHEERRARKRLEQVGLDLDPSTLVERLSPVEQSLVAIARALDDIEGTTLLVLDEPTASLPRNEVERLFAAVRMLAEAGGAVLYVSHRLDEVMALTESITVLRDGSEVCTVSTDEVDHDSLIELIIGYALGDVIDQADHDVTRDVALRVTDLSGPTVNGVSFDVHVGEIVGVTGLTGSGAFELGGLVFGSTARHGGRLEVHETELARVGPAHSIRAGVGYVPPDRQVNSVIGSFDQRENLTLPRLRARGWGPVQWLSARAEERETRGWLERLDVRPPDPRRRPGTLSGGNQQKAILARWFRCEPVVLVLDEPVHGVDVGAKQVIYEKVAEAAAGGAGVLICTAEIDDLVAVCDRVLVMRDGRVAQELAGDAMTAGRILQASLAQRSPTQP